MKCKHCDGTGTTNWCVNGIFVNCPYCFGTGEMEVEQTNEDWFNNLSTSAKSEFMAKVVSDAIKENTEHGATRCESSIWWDEWLKQPHTPKE